MCELCTFSEIQLHIMYYVYTKVSSAYILTIDLTRLGNRDETIWVNAIRIAYCV